jgi:hypothetical protein
MFNPPLYRLYLIVAGEGFKDGLGIIHACLGIENSDLLNLITNFGYFFPCHLIGQWTVLYHCRDKFCLVSLSLVNIGRGSQTINVYLQLRKSLSEILVHLIHGCRIYHMSVTIP